MPWDEGYWIRCSRLFEMHDLRLIGQRGKAYMERLAGLGVPLYMQKAYFEQAQEYPFDMVAAVTGRYWNSSIGYMLALAIAEGVDRIGLWGVDMKGDDEYGYQRPNCEYLIGLARGRGIDVVIPDESPLCKFQGEGIRFLSTSPAYVGCYGWLGDVN